MLLLLVLLQRMKYLENKGNHGIFEQTSNPQLPWIAMFKKLLLTFSLINFTQFTICMNPNRVDVEPRQSCCTRICNALQNLSITQLIIYGLIATKAVNIYSNHASHVNKNQPQEIAIGEIALYEHNKTHIVACGTTYPTEENYLTYTDENKSCFLVNKKTAKMTPVSLAQLKKLGFIPEL